MAKLTRRQYLSKQGEPTGGEGKDIFQIIEERITHFIDIKYHTHEAKRLTAALLTIRELMPPDSISEFLTGKECNTCDDLPNSFGDSYKCQSCEQSQPVKPTGGEKECESEIGDYKCHVRTNIKDKIGRTVSVDKCLKDAVELLNKHGYSTIASCCGHGKVSPTILIDQSQPAEIAIRGGRGWINRTANDFILDTGKISPRYRRL